MENNNLTHKDIFYDFNKKWPSSFPILEWKGCPYAGHFGLENKIECVEVSLFCDTFEKALFEAYPSLGLCQLAELYGFNSPIEFDYEKWLSFYNLKWNENLKNLFLLLKKTPKEFQNWVNEKQIGARELFPLKAIQAEKDFEFLQSLLKQVALVNPSRSRGVQILEWSIDLYLMGELSLSPAASHSAEDDWHESLKDKRFSQRTQAKKNLEAQLQSVAWPKGAQAIVFESGDRVGVELRLKANDVTDLAKKISLLSQSKVQSTHAL